MLGVRDDEELIVVSLVGDAERAEIDAERRALGDAFWHWPLIDGSADDDAIVDNPSMWSLPAAGLAEILRRVRDGTIVGDSDRSALARLIQYAERLSRVVSQRERDRRRTAILLHCVSGKDRTGALAAAFLMLHQNVSLREAQCRSNIVALKGRDDDERLGFFVRTPGEMALVDWFCAFLTINYFMRLAPCFTVVRNVDSDLLRRAKDLRARFNYSAATDERQFEQGACVDLRGRAVDCEHV